MPINKDNIAYAGPVIDLHCHVLPGLDDGAADFDQALNMLRLAEAEGTETVVATPHLVCDGSERQYVARAKETAARLREHAGQAGIRVRVLLGFELLLSPMIQHTDDIMGLTLEGSNRLLVELQQGDPRDVLGELLYEAGHYGVSLILAHPERSGWLAENRSYLEGLLDGGVSLQVNADSITGAWGRNAAKFAHRLAQGGHISHIGSDAHSDTVRPPCVRQALSMLQTWLGEEAARRIAYENAHAYFPS